MSDEFEEQQQSDVSLGELPPPVSNERGESYTPDPVKAPPYFANSILQARSSIPPDIAAENARRELEGGIHSPKINKLVNSTFDTLPVNARDFYHTGTVTVNSNEDLNIDPTQFDFVVPSGYIGILRGFKFHNDDMVFPDTFSYVKTSVLIEGITHPDYSLLILGQSSNGMIPIHALANENKTISLQFHPSLAFANATLADTQTFVVTLFGNLLLSRGLPLEFENISQTTSNF